jgi:para-nitrobenzyl esterase
MKSPAWYYKYLRAPPIPADSDIVEKDFAGTFHLAGMQSSFGTLDGWKWNWSDSDRLLSQRMMETWFRFLWTGNPGPHQGGADPWLALSNSSDVIRIWDENGESRLESLGEHATKVAAFWDAHYLRDRIISKHRIELLL